MLVLIVLLVGGHTVAGVLTRKCGVCECYNRNMDCSLRYVATLGYTKVDENIEILNISHNQLNDLERENFMTDTLVSLVISNNAVTLVPSYTFSKCTSLHYLSLSGNKIAHLEVKSFFGPMNLHTLDLSNNYISYLLPSTFECIPYIWTINLSNNRIEQILPHTFGVLNYLEDLNLSGNAIVNVDISVFPKTLHLLNVHLSQNKIAHFRGLMDKVSQISQLDLSNNKLTMLSAQTLSGMENLREINVANNNIYSVDTEFLCIVSKRRIQVVLTNNPLTCDNDLLRKETSQCNAAHSVHEFLKNCSLTTCQGNICKIPLSNFDSWNETKPQEHHDINNEDSLFKNTVLFSFHLFTYLHFGEISFFILAFVFIIVAVLFIYLRISYKRHYYTTNTPERVQLV